MIVNKQKTCADADINTKGFCDYGAWWERGCYCQLGPCKGLRCPYAYKPIQKPSDKPYYPNIEVDDDF